MWYADWPTLLGPRSEEFLDAIAAPNVEGAQVHFALPREVGGRVTLHVRNTIHAGPVLGQQRLDLHEALR